jgi:hypothetical protein
MIITIEIKERPSGDVEVRIHNAAGMVTTREDRYATELTKSIKNHLANEMPAIVKRILNQERN